MNDEKAKKQEKQYFLDIFVSGSENDSTIEVLIQISKNHELLKGQFMTFRNTAVDMVQEAGLTKMPDGMRKVNVRILWADTATEKYIFEYGVGWNKEVQ
ncbi:MAG: hypothetical protein PWR27_1791 [Petroclostridium sp.]|jgi:hypothetical protein|uniref:hypothetical protein n=1 Tax=Petroclostridium xylanilyticum TaxID=1792311 RepID=UPI000B97FFFB|nr:hypothetical protein [Petroclostridium xylanilyticum]MDK2811082.1 hypothetical protein [Petroclostridium sp.]